MSARLSAIVKDLGLCDGMCVLEIGCGHGVAGTLICERIGGGRYLGLDRSSAMIDAATRRNADHVTAGRAEFVRAAFEEVDLGARRFDLVLAVRVGLFDRDPPRARALAEQWLAPGGRIVAHFDPPSAAGPV